MAQTRFEVTKNKFLARQATNHRLQQTGSTKKLNTVDGTMWTGPLYMGSTNYSVDVIFDTASDWLTVEGQDCPNCEGNTYDITKSNKAKKVGQNFSQRFYGATALSGIEWTDQVCVTLQACINDFEFFLIHAQEGLKEPVDGVLGMARNKAFYLSKEEEKTATRGPSYMMAMQNAGLISENTFSHPNIGRRSPMCRGIAVLQDLRSRMK